MADVAGLCFRVGMNRLFVLDFGQGDLQSWITDTGTHIPYTPQRHAASMPRSPLYCTSMNFAFGALQTGHFSGAPPRTVLPHTWQTTMLDAGRSVPPFTAFSAVEYRP